MEQLPNFFLVGQAERRNRERSGLNRMKGLILVHVIQ